MDNVITELIQLMREQNQIQRDSFSRVIELYNRVLDIRQGRVTTEIHTVTLPRSSITPFLNILQSLNQPEQPQGLSDEQIENNISNVIVVDTSDICAICQHTLNENNETYGFPRRINNCGHQFHRNCIHRSLHLNPNCPLCRTNVLTLSNDSNDSNNTQEHPEIIGESDEL
jgi:hypothetical protein